MMAEPGCDGFVANDNNRIAIAGRGQGFILQMCTVCDRNLPAMRPDDSPCFRERSRVPSRSTDRFVDVSQTVADIFEGCGLILSIPRSGDLPAPFGRGPIQRQCRTQGPWARSEDREDALQILLVEDHEDTARMIALLLRSEGHEVATASTLAAALDMAKASRFDIIVSDLGLPDASGLDLIRELRRHDPALKAIALSGYGMEEDVRRSREAGFAEHLIKPVNFDKLNAAILRVSGT
jgi:CheY-like chemotaxis protein